LASTNSAIDSALMGKSVETAGVAVNVRKSLSDGESACALLEKNPAE